jgi:hypothetical protein
MAGFAASLSMPHRLQEGHGRRPADAAGPVSTMKWLLAESARGSGAGRVEAMVTGPPEVGEQVAHQAAQSRVRASKRGPALFQGSVRAVESCESPCNGGIIVFRAGKGESR